MENQTEVSEFILTGLSLRRHWELQKTLFTFFLLLYFVILLGNGAIVAVVIAEPQLHTPMYFFLGNLSCLDIFYSTVTVPKMLAGFLSELQTISFGGCMAQLHFFHFLGSSEVILLGFMAYDRYVAICNPLRYTIIMRKQVCRVLAATTWTTGFSHALMHTVMTSHLLFCGPNRVEHFFCDIKPLLKLACSSTHLNLMLLNTVTSCIAMGPFVVTLLSYLYIIHFLLFKVHSQKNRQKAFSTCMSHLMVVALLYVPVLVNYMLPSVGTEAQREMMVTIIYSAVTPALNPLIYTLRNQEVKKALQKILRRKIFNER
ncbi:olfactory receptor 12D2-like [Sphaerodactylus townsendi]|uniref:olfactory receptor 12D2-like n=1 Tax=Sphaerodactylus townsendi TaxID=933632 RepID=UPI0020272107|nr:olfactory receptor 12D2-like [Sphaerodactylus townsendi]